MADGNAVDALIDRECEVFTLTTEIGKRLLIADNAVHKHTGNI
ncbi:hypothetical protein AB0K71_23540 [Streptomyces syringium]